MKKIFKLCLSIFCVSVVFINLSGCGNSSDKKKSLEEKINTEIAYVDSELFSIANNLNNIDYTKYKVVEEQVDSSSGGSTEGGQSEKSNGKSSEEANQQQSSGNESSKSNESSESKQEGQKSDTSNKTFSMKPNNILGKNEDIKWEDLKNKIEDLYTTWTIVNSDLKTVDVPQEQLDKFNENMDVVAIAIKNENKDETMTGIVKLYELLPKFVEKYSNQDTQKNILYSKYNLLLCYKYADLEKWDEFENSLSSLKMSFSNVSNDKEKYGGKEINITNANTIINEMSNTMNIKDKDIFLIKYKNLIEELNVILDI